MTNVVCRWRGLWAGMFLGALSALANDPGGGTNGVGPNVTLTDNGTSVVLANGTLSATITKSNAKITSLLYRGRQMVSGDIYFSMDGGASYEQPSGCVYSVKNNSGDMVDIGMRCFGTNRIHKFDIEIHYVLRRGDSGVYVYALLDHPASYPDTGVGEWRMVWKMNQDQTERIYVDNLRNWQKPSAADLAAGTVMPIAEITRLNTGPWAGRYTCKYMYSVEYEEVGCFGHASNTNKIGVWAVFGNFDYFNDGPTKQDLAPADGIIHIHFGRNHYNASSTSVAAGEAWTKMYGPWLLYLNTNSAGGDACWADAKAQVAAEKSAWPYAWLTGNTNYPPASGRGAVSGRLVVSDPFKPTLTGANAWVGLAQPEPGGNWQFESKRYQYWVKADALGNFTIPHVRPGVFTLYAFVTGAVGEYSLANVAVSAGATNALGNILWTVPHPGGQLAWEIGIPDRTAREFRFGTNYWEPYLWEKYRDVLPNPLDYTVGASNWTNDWNYAHPGYLSNNVWSPWKWRINFNLTNPPTGGDAVLTMAWASANYGSVQVFVNDENTLLADVGPTCYGGPTGGNALIREGIHAKYGVSYVSIPTSMLRHGTNRITLVQRRSSAASDHVMYDYLSLELPPGPPVPPPGRNLLWRGAAAANSWDLNSSTNWVAGGTAVVFTNGDNVTFDDSGSNSTAISTSGTMVPGSMTVSANKNYTVGGSGTLDGTMVLTKSGTGTLVLNGVNKFAGGTYLAGGVISLGAGETNNQGIGTGPITFAGGTLQMNGYAGNNGTYWDNLPNALVVPAGQTGTLRTPARIASPGLSGRLTGGGTLNVVADYVRGIFSGDWSEFTGVIRVTPRSGTAEFRLNNSFGLPNGALEVAAGVTVYHINGNTRTIPVGELSGTGTLGPGNGNSLHPTWRVGSRNTSSTFAGRILDAGITSLQKIGSGTLELSGTNAYSGLTGIGGGTLLLTGQILTTNFVVVSNSATLELTGHLGADTLLINTGGTLEGCGTLAGNLVNYGTVTVACGPGSSLRVTGNVTNQGTMQLMTGSGLQVTGSFVNNGLLDMLTGAPGLPAGFINNGVVIDSSAARVLSLTRSNQTVRVTIQGYVGHNYQLQRASSLAAPVWNNVGLAEPGDGSVLTLEDPAATESQNFYRVLVNP